MTWNEISKHAQKGESLGEDAFSYEHEIYHALRFLYAELKRYRGTPEENRIRNEAAFLKGEFLRRQRELSDKTYIFTTTAYKLMKENPDKKCSEILELLEPLRKEMEDEQ